MINLDTTAYMWIKAFHIISVIAWMAGMLYLPRLFVYHCDAKPGSQHSETFKTMERKLLHGIINPAMIVVVVLGGLLLANLDVESWLEGWLLTKLFLVVLLIVLHGMMSRWRKDFANDNNNRTANFYRWMNEIPAILMAGIVILAVVKPF